MDTEQTNRFLKKIKKTPNCWEWKAQKNIQGYGLLWFREGGRRFFRKAHRLMWELENGEIEKGKYICHSCDNPGCVRPSHLFIGTANDNNQDKIKKGRNFNLSRASHPMAKLTEAQVSEIRNAKASATKRFWGAKDLAYRLGISYPHLCKIAKGSSWKFLT